MAEKRTVTAFFLQEKGSDGELPPAFDLVRTITPQYRYRGAWYNDDSAPGDSQREVLGTMTRSQLAAFVKDAVEALAWDGRE